MILKIRNMVCRHCVETVRRVLTDAGFNVENVTLGQAEITPAPSAEQIEKIAGLLRDNDFELIADPDIELVDATKRAVIHHVRNISECRLNLSACLSEHLGLSYDYISRVFSRIEGRTIERYHILQKVERVKELLTEPGMTLAEAADIAGYSSAAHLSSQFKEVTGMTTSQFLSSGASATLRQSLDKV